MPRFLLYISKLILGIGIGININSKEFYFYPISVEFHVLIMPFGHDTIMQATNLRLVHVHEDSFVRQKSFHTN